MKRRYNTRPQRIDPEFEKEMRAIARTRLDKGLARLNMKDLSMAEMTRLLRRTEAWKQAKQELMTKPKKEDIKKPW